MTTEPSEFRLAIQAADALIIAAYEAALIRRAVLDGRLVRLELAKATDNLTLLDDCEWFRAERAS